MTNKKAVVYIRLKDGVLDPQGITIERAILNMGYDSVAQVRSGRVVDRPRLPRDRSECHIRGVIR